MLFSLLPSRARRFGFLRFFHSLSTLTVEYHSFPLLARVSLRYPLPLSYIASLDSVLHHLRSPMPLAKQCTHGHRYGRTFGGSIESSTVRAAAWNTSRLPKRRFPRRWQIVSVITSSSIYNESLSGLMTGTIDRTPRLSIHGIEERCQDQRSDSG